MSLLKIAFSNIKKRKSGMLTLLVMVIVASLILTVGLSLILGLNGFFEKKTEELHSSHVNVYAIDTLWQDKMLETALAYDKTVQAETENVYQNSSVGIKGTDLSFKFAAHAMNAQRDIAPLKVLEKLNSLPQNAIVLPLSLKNYGFAAGDTITITANQTEKPYIIYGFFEDAEFGATQITFKRFYFSDDAFLDFAANKAFRSGKYMTVRFEDVKISGEFMRDFSERFSMSQDVFMFSIESSKMYATNFISLISTFVLIFAIVIFIVALIITRFNIINSVEDDIVNMGALKSVGYSNRQIILSIILQYTVIAAAAFIIGGLAGVFVSPVIGNILAVNSSLLWIKGFNIASFFIALSFILLMTAAISYMAGRRTKRITPVNALRSGISAHSYETNKAAIQKSRLSLHANLALKNFLNNMKNNITIFLVVTLFIFASLAGLLLQYNFSNDKTALNRMIGIELYPTVAFFENQNQDYIDDLLSDNDVERISYIDGIYIMYEGISVYLEAVDDYSNKEYQGNCYAGSYPRFSNEICIGGSMAKSMGKSLGDMITVTVGGVPQEFKISGLTQYLKEGGFVFNITLDGFSGFYDNYQAKMIKVYLKDSSSTENFIARYSAKLYGAAEITNDKKYVEAVSGSLENTINLVFAVIIISTILIIFLVLFLMISTLIRKNKKNLGILKGVGFSNWQLMRQIIYTFMPVIIISGIIGLLLCFLAVNPVISLALRSMGMMYSSFKIPILNSVIITAGIMLFSFIVSLIISLRIKSLSAIKLIVE